MNGYDPDVILNGNFITIKKANRFHSGRYQCLAEDGSEHPAMEAITVIVNCELIADSCSAGVACYSASSASVRLIYFFYLNILLRLMRSTFRDRRTRDRGEEGNGVQRHRHRVGDDMHRKRFSRG